MDATVDIRAAGDTPVPSYDSLDSWLEAGGPIAARRSDAAWAAADWLLDGESAFGEAALSRAPEKVGWSRAKCSNYCKVAGLWPAGSRREGLTFSHHLEVAGLPADDRERLLDAAVAGRWTRDQLRDAARERDGRAETEQLRARVKKLETQLEAERMTPAQVEESRTHFARSVRSDCRGIGDTYKRMVAGIHEYLDGPAFRALHGNAQRAELKRVRDELTAARKNATALINESLGLFIGPLDDDRGDNGGSQ